MVFVTLAKIAKPTLVMTGTDDNAYEPDQNSLIIAGKIPGLYRSKMLVIN
jgi:pimeloyl-ACP methyl ester carboxylesterase